MTAADQPQQPAAGEDVNRALYGQLLDSSGREVKQVVHVFEDTLGGPVEVLYIGTHGPMTAIFDEGRPVPAHVREGW